MVLQSGIYFGDDQMPTDWRIGLRLDTRAIKGSGLFPIKLRLYAGHLHKARMFRTGKECAKMDFEKILDRNINVKGNNLELRTWCEKFIERANKITKDTSVYSFNDFKNKFVSAPKTKASYVISDYIRNILIEDYAKAKTITSLKGSANKLDIHFNQITFFDLTSDKLDSFSKSMSDLGLSDATIGIHMRNIKIAFNHARKPGENQIMPESIYPFHDFKIKTYSNDNKKNRPLYINEIKELTSYKPKNLKQKKSKNFFMLSYHASGMNLVDIALIKKTDLEHADSGLKFSFIRKKTKDSTSKRVSVNVNKIIQDVFNEYGNGSEYIFPILKGDETDSQIDNRVGNFAKTLNEGLKEIAEELTISNKLSMVWARHTFASKVYNSKKFTIKEIGNMLGHSSVATTERYLGSIGIIEIDKVQDVL